MRRLLILAYAAASASAKKAVIGFDIGTESVRAGLFDAQTGELLATKSHPHETRFPQPGYAEQSPAAWWDGMGELSSSRVRRDADVGRDCLAATSCTVVACRRRRAAATALWMDQRAAAE